MQLACVQCGAAVPAVKIDVGRFAVQCPECGGWINAAIALETAEARTAAPPRRLRIEKARGELTISRNWLSGDLILLVPFALFWDSVLVAWYWGVLTDHEFSRMSDYLGLLFPIIHVLIGAGLTYVATARLVNRSTVRADRENLLVQHGPLPWCTGSGWLAKSVYAPLDAVERIGSFTAGGRVGIRRPDFHGRVASDFTVEAVLRDGERVPLFVCLNNVEQARWLECFLNDYLGVEALAGPELGQR